MHPDYSWQTLCRPQQATEYFTLKPAPSIRINKRAFSIVNAWWLAELSRLVYRSDFHNNKDINLGGLQYELISFIDNEDTAIQVAVFLLNAVDQENKPANCLAIVFRGTDDMENWNLNAKTYQNDFLGLGNVHEGFRSAYLSIRDELHSSLSDFSLPIFVSGHSLGGALATLTTAELSSRSEFDACYTYGSPRVVSPEFISTLNTDCIYRVVNNSDVVTTVPVSFVNIEYQHIGESFLLNDKGKLIEGLDEDQVLDYQKERLHDLKHYALREVFSRNIKNIRDNLPPFLADHAPKNYVMALQGLI